METENQRHKLYIIGGVARVGKSIIAREMSRRKCLTVLPADSIRSAIRYVLMGNPAISPGKISFQGMATYGSNQTLPFERNGQSEDDLAALGVFALSMKYDRTNAYDVLFEGVSITPKLVSELKLNNLDMKVAFIGYNNASHAESILTHSKKEKDYIYTEMVQSGKGDEYVKDTIQNGIKHSDEIKQQAQALGYKYFDATKIASFEEHVQAVVDYLLKE